MKEPTDNFGVTSEQVAKQALRQEKQAQAHTLTHTLTVEEPTATLTEIPISQTYPMDEEVDCDDFEDQGIPNYSVFRINSTIPLDSLLPESLYGIGGGIKTPLGAKITTFLQAFSRVPEPRVQYPLLASVVLQPSALAEQQLPIVFFQGDSGTGKSEMVKLFSAFRNLPIEDGTDAATRDAINIGRFGKKSGGKFDDHYLLLTDNNGEDDMVRRPDFYKMLLKGYDRGTSRLSISGGINDDNPKVFDCFCMKVISSVFPLDNDERIREIRRRFLIFQFSKNYTTSPLNPKSYDFTPTQKEIRAYWRHKPNCIRYRESGLYVRSQSKYIIKQIGDENYYLLLELITTALVSGITKTLEEFVELLKLQIQRNSQREKSDLEQYLIDLLTLDSGTSKKLITKVSQANLQSILRQGINEGSLENQNTKLPQVKQVMARLGYKKDRSVWVKKA